MKSTHGRTTAFLLTLLLSISVIGCSSGDDGNLGSVSGTVTLDGKPYPGAVVTYTPSNNQGRPSKGLTDESGQYELIYIRTTRGAEKGDHRVRITTLPPSGPPEVVSKIKFKETVPKKYNTRSELTATVESGSNEINFELDSK